MRGLVVWLVAVLIRVVGGTLRVRRLGWGRVHELRRRGEPFAFAVWHGRTPLLLAELRGERCLPLVSLSADGDRAADILRSLGYGVVRGSTSRGGAEGLLRLAREARDGGVPAVTVDGPRGPAESVAPGVVGLAQATGLWIVPVAASCRRGWRLTSWDRARLPRPGSRAVVLAGRPVRVARTDDREDATARLSERMRSLHRTADRVVGARR